MLNTVTTQVYFRLGLCDPEPQCSQLIHLLGLGSDMANVDLLLLSACRHPNFELYGCFCGFYHHAALHQI
jgi:hypothetical protein